MKHSGTVEIKTEHLILRPFVMEDAETAYRNWCGDPRVTEFLRWKTHDSVSVTEVIMKFWIDCYERNNFYQWAICLPDGENIGTISTVDIFENISTLHIGFALGSRWWNRGYMSEALRAVIDYFFETVGAGRVESQYDPENPASGRVMEKCGMVKEGVLRKRDWSNRGVVDAVMCSVLREDWEASRR